MNAVDFHSDIAREFSNLYQQSPDFRKRYAVWSALLDRFITPTSRVLDAGCGTGIFSRYAAQKGASVVAVDGSATMIELAGQQAQQQGLAIQFNVAMLPLSPQPWGEFDVVMSSSVLEYVPDLPGSLRSLARLVRPGGILMISMPNQQSVYRLLEQGCYRLMRRPVYLEHVFHQATAASLYHQLGTGNFDLLTQQTYGGMNTCARLLRTCLPTRYADTLFVAVFQKK